MNDFDKIFEEFNFSDKAEKSLNEFSNWIFSISLGICALLILNFGGIETTGNCLIRTIYIILVIYSMLNILLTGYNKYLFIKRDTILSIKYGELKKLGVFQRIKNEKLEEITIKWNKIFSEWTAEYNKISMIGKILNISLITTVILIITSGMFILISLIK